MELLLTKSTTPVIGWIAQLLGWLMNGIYEGMAHINAGMGKTITVFGSEVSYANIGLAIILYTIIIYLAMTPLQIKQQKNSKMMSVVQPELAKIQEKYKGRTDQASRMKMQEETMALYSKYGVSMSGSCVTLAIQLPLLFALYQVIYKIPGYITRVGSIFNQLAVKIQGITGYEDLLKKFLEESSVRGVAFKDAISTNRLVDFLYLLKPAQWTKLASADYFGSLSSDINDVARFSARINNFAGINISESPFDVIRSHPSVIVVIIAVLVPVLAWFTQWLNYKLMPQAGTDAEQGAMAGSMKTMNNVMPIFSAFLCITFSMGIGIYWIAGAVIRCIQQVVINRRIARMDANTLIEAAREKQAKKAEKQGITRQNQNSTITSSAHRSVKRIEDPKYKDLDKRDVNYSETARNAAPDSIMAKANMVARFDERNAQKGRNKGQNNKQKNKADGQPKQDDKTTASKK